MKKIIISNPNKVWFPRSKISKAAVVEYYERASAYQLPLIKNHLLTMQRYPNGIKGQMFYQKNAGSYFPSWVATVAVRKEEGGTVDYVVAKNRETLVYLANQAALTIHYWLSKATALHKPDRIIFDLDPSVNNFARVRAAALLIKDICDAEQLPCFAMTTGSEGMHVYIPIKRLHTFDEVSKVATYIAQQMIKKSPKEFTLEVRKNKRGTKIFIDTLRNRYSATAVVPYSVRSYEKAPVAMPLWWKEVNAKLVSSQQFTIATVLAHRKKVGDPWKKMMGQAVSLKKILNRIGDA